MKKIIVIIISAILVTFIVYMVEESIRLKNSIDAKPLIVLDKDFCNKDSLGCYNNTHEYDEEDVSLGFTYRKRYLLEEGSTEDNIKYHINSAELYLFDKFLIWAWIE